MHAALKQVVRDGTVAQFDHRQRRRPTAAIAVGIEPSEAGVSPCAQLPTHRTSRSSNPVVFSTPEWVVLKIVSASSAIEKIEFLNGSTSRIADHAGILHRAGGSLQ
jgi:hypothetical protein